MQKLFNNMLVPVILDRRTDATIERAVQFANQLQCHLHLVGTAPISSLQARYCQVLEKGQVLSVHFDKGDLEEIVASYVATHLIDLVYVAGERKKFPFIGKSLNVNRLAGRTNCPVLSLKSNLVLNGLKIIVVPVGKSIPINKIRVAAYLAKRYKASIHLITREKNGLMFEELAYMQKALQVLKDNTDLPVKCKTLTGESIGNIALQYAQEVKAGLIVVNPGIESFLPGMLNRLFSRFIYNESKIPVLTVL